MSPCLILAAVITSAIALLAAAADAAPERPRIFSFCNGHIRAIPSVKACPDGSLRIVG
jgi:hypothetical protein